MIGGTLFSGIGAPEVSAPWIDWRWSADIDPFANAVRAHHWPDVPNLGDVAQINGGEIERPDVIVFGSPCQSYSVAGKRLGLDDPRGNLALVALGLVDAVRPSWVVFENVPGLLSSFSGSEHAARQARESVTGKSFEGEENRDFATFLAELRECGYCCAWRVLDAQFAGVPQRRRRIFLVGHLGDDWRPPAAVLFEPESLRGHPPPSREAEEGFAPRSGASAQSSRRDGLVISTGEASHCLNAGGMGRQDYETETLITHTLRAEGFDASEDGTGRGTPIVAFNARQDPDHWSGHTGPLDAGAAQAVSVSVHVRRLTPLECERLQGFPDGFTDIPWRKGRAPDGRRYKALGNSMAVPVIGWVLERIRLFEEAVH